jgi:glycosyltransferase involved in cell wall biosynthesis
MKSQSASALDARGLPPVYLCGPIARAGEAARGGYQACNRRTLDALRQAGADVRPLPFPHPRASGLRKMAEYALGFLALYGRVLKCPRGAILHLTALSVHFIYLEWVIVRLARLRGCHVLFDLRAGAGLINYEERTAVYRLAFDATARTAELCLVEGEELLPFVSRSSRRPTYHFPNHLDTSAIAPRRDDDLPGAPTVAYAGRVVPEKGIETLLDACRELAARGLAPEIRIAGDGDPAYLADLRDRYSDLAVQWLGPLQSADVLDMLRSAHFFVFPTRHFGEGQSNALTEALACGCVCLVSRHGFNASVVGEAGVVLEMDARPPHYAQHMVGLWSAPERWRALSEASRRRAALLFSTRPVISRLIAHYRAMAGRQDTSRPSVL